MKRDYAYLLFLNVADENTRGLIFLDELKIIEWFS